MADPCDPANASCPPQTLPPLLTQEDWTAFRQAARTVSTAEEVRLSWETLERIRVGNLSGSRLPLPWGHAGLFRIPVLGEVFLHVSQDAFAETLEPIQVENGIIRSGLIRIHGDVGITLNKGQGDRMGKDGPPLLGRVETVRFKAGKIWTTFHWFSDEIVESNLPNPDFPSGESDAIYGALFFNGLFHLGLEWFLGETNENEEYDMTQFLKERGWNQFFEGLALRKLADFARWKFETGSTVLRAMNFPDLHQLNADGMVSFRNPLLQNPATGERIRAGWILGEIHPPIASTDQERLDAFKIRMSRVEYENRTLDLRADIHGLEFAIRDDFDFRSPLYFSGSGEIRWNRIDIDGPKKTSLALGCSVPPCELPQRVTFFFEMSPHGLAVHIENTENQLYTPEEEVVGRILPSFINLAVNLKGQVALGGAIAVDASTQVPIDLTRTLKASADGLCHLLPESEDLLSGDLSVGFDCVAWGSRIEWYNDLGQMGLRVQIPPDTEATLEGRIEKKGDLVTIEVPALASHVDLDAPLIVRAMELIAKTTGMRPVLKNVRVVIRPDGTKEFLIEAYRADVATNLKSSFFENPMESRLKTHPIRAVLSPQKDLEIVSQDPSRQPYFLETNASGEIRLPGVLRRPLPIDTGRLQMARVSFDYRQQRAEFRGRLEIVHDNVPEKYLPKGITVRSPGDRPQTFRLRVIADGWALRPPGIVEILSGQVSLEALDTERPAAAKEPLPTAPAPSPLDFTLPPLEGERKTGLTQNLFSLEGIFRVGMGLFDSVQGIPRFQISVPQGKGEPEIAIPFPKIPILYPPLKDAISVSLRFPRDNAWQADVRTAPDPATGREVFQRAVVYLREPAHICLNVYGRCVTMEDFRLKKIELVTAGDRTGAVILHPSTGPQPDLVKMILEMVRIHRKEAEALGVKIEKNGWRFPIGLEEMGRILAAAQPSEQSLSEAMPGRMVEEPDLGWQDATGRVDLTFKGGLREICGEGIQDHPHIFVQMDPNSRLSVSRSDPRGPIRVGTLRVPLLGVAAHLSHPGRRETVRSPFFFFMRDLQVERPVIDLIRGRAETALHVREIPFSLGRPGSPYLWRGKFSDVEARGFSWSPSEFRGDRVRYDFTFRKHPFGEAGDSAVFPVEFRGSPSFRDLFLRTLPEGILEIGYSSVDDTVSFSGPHFAARNVVYHAEGARMQTHLTDNPVQGDVALFVPKIDFREGEMEVASGPLKISRPGSARETVLIVRDDEVLISSEEIDTTFSGLPLNFVRNLGFPQGFEFLDLQMGDLRFHGPVALARMSRGDVDITGRVEKDRSLALATEGTVKFRYQDPDAKVNVREFESAFHVRIGSLKRLKTDHGELSLLEFDGFESSFDRVGASVVLFNLLKSRLGFTPQIHPTGGTLRAKSGRIEISKEAGQAAPWAYLRLSGVEFEFQGRSRETAMEFQKGKLGGRVVYPDMTVKILAQEGEITAVRDYSGKWHYGFIVGSFRMETQFKRTTIRGRP